MRELGRKPSCFASKGGKSSKRKFKIPTCLYSSNHGANTKENCGLLFAPMDHLTTHTTALSHIVQENVILFERLLPFAFFIVLQHRTKKNLSLMLQDNYFSLILFSFRITKNKLAVGLAGYFFSSWTPVCYSNKIISGYNMNLCT